MDNMKWEPVDVTPRSTPRGTPYVRVSNGSMTFNAAAAGLIEDIGQYPWVRVQVGTVEGKPTALAFHFLKEGEPGAFAVKKQSKNHKGFTIFSRELVKRYIPVTVVGIMLLRLYVEKLDETALLVRLPGEEESSVDAALEFAEKQLEKAEEYLDNLL